MEDERVNEKLSWGAEDWLIDRGWRLDRDNQIWFKPGVDGGISMDVLEVCPEECYNLALKLEGEIPWFSNPSSVLVYEKFKERVIDG